VPSSALKKMVPPTRRSSLGQESPVGLMSFTRTVLAAVPSVFQSSWPLWPSVALK